LLLRYADGSPEFRIGVHVLVVVKRMVTAKMFWRTCMKGHYSPDIQAESRIFDNGWWVSFDHVPAALSCARDVSGACGMRHIEASRAFVPLVHVKTFLKSFVFYRLRRGREAAWAGILTRHSEEASRDV